MDDLETSLFCDEDSSYLNERDQEQERERERVRVRESTFTNPHFYSFASEEEEEYIEKMFNRESFFFGFGSSETRTQTQTRQEPGRPNAIDWIFNTRELFGFNYRTLYLSITYLDRFLSKRAIDRSKDWVMSLLSVACLTLAAKIEESRIPALPNFLVGDNFFDGKFVQKMELLVLTELEWKMGSLTPFSYLYYFVAKFVTEEPSSSSKELVISNAIELILAMTKETKLNEYRPSIVAASAVLVVSLDGEFTRDAIELKTSNAIKFWQSQDRDDLWSCCEVLREIERVRKVKTPQELASSYFTRNDNIASSSISKRRLSFNDPDQEDPASKTRRT